MCGLGCAPPPRYGPSTLAGRAWPLHTWYLWIDVLGDGALNTLCPGQDGGWRAQHSPTHTQWYVLMFWGMGGQASVALVGHAHTHTHIYIHIYIYMDTYIYTYIYIYIFMFTHIYICVIAQQLDV